MPPRHRPALVLAALTAAGALTAGVLLASPAPAAQPSATTATSSTTPSKAASAPAFLLPSTARTSSVHAPRAVTGTSTLVTLDTSVLPKQAAGQRVGFDLGQKTVTGTFDSADSSKLYDSWTGSFDGGAEGTFAIARSGGVVRGTLSTTEGTYAISQATGDQYWLTAVKAFEPTEDDVLTASPADVARAEALPAGADEAPVTLEKKRKGKTKITVVFAYTKATKAALGTKSGVKAVAGLIVAQTNASLKNSKVKTKLKLRGVAKTKGTETDNSSQNTVRLRKPRDGKFDSALRFQRKKHADLVHLLTNVPPTTLCGAAYMPVSPGQASRRYDLSQGSTHLACVDDLSPVHELGHNMGADHLIYPGITHDSKIKGNVAYADPAHGFFTLMSYYDPCTDAGVNCYRVPFYSNPKTTFNGLPVGSPEANNAKAIKKISPRVARYR